MSSSELFERSLQPLLRKSGCRSVELWCGQPLARLAIFCFGVGTSALKSAVHPDLKERQPSVEMIATDPVEGASVWTSLCCGMSGQVQSCCLRCYVEMLCRLQSVPLGCQDADSHREAGRGYYHSNLSEGLCYRIDRST